MPRTNYFYLTGRHETLRVWFVDENRQASIAASGRLWTADVSAWYGGTGRQLLPMA